VQCKWGACDGETIQVRLTSTYHSPTRGYVTRTYAPDEVDAVAAYCEITGKCYLLPIERVAKLRLFTLRLSPARNSQRASLNSAAEYEFPGAVAQLEERVAGSDEVRGSSPLSSTTQEVVSESVGMDRFYARLAHHVRRAEAGGEVVVTRRGRPVARLVPFDLNLTGSAADA
jgi:prevent-host-death family protein